MRKLFLGIILSLFFSVPAQAAPGAPDLIVTSQTAATYTVSDTYFPAGDCAVAEGLIPSVGWHKLLRFGTNTANIGRADLQIGNPSAHPELFYYSSCHGHWHFDRFAEYRLLDVNGATVGLGHKQAFCITDTGVYDPSLAKSIRPRYTNCNRNQGLSRGWYDEYGAGLDGQWVIVDGEFVNGIPQGIPSGQYMLEVTVNYASVLVESNYSNNSRLVPVVIP